MPKGFGFITFESEEAVENVLQKRFHEVKNKMWRSGGLVSKLEEITDGRAYGYGHYLGCLYGEDPYNGAWNIRRVLHAWTGYLESNEDLLTYVNPEASYSYA
ncbi:hypothetical protein M0R45_001509 [Rubus argutus]